MELKVSFAILGRVQREEQGKYCWEVPHCVYWAHQIGHTVLCQPLNSAFPADSCWCTGAITLTQAGDSHQWVTAEFPPEAGCLQQASHCTAHLVWLVKATSLVSLVQSTKKPRSHRAGRCSKWNQYGLTWIGEYNGKSSLPMGVECLGPQAGKYIYWLGNYLGIIVECFVLLHCVLW